MASHVDEISSEHEVSGAGLDVISIGNLMNGDKETCLALLQACMDLGFFYLDCRDHPSVEVITEISEIAAASLEFYDLPESQKNAWDFRMYYEKDAEFKFRYKPAGDRSGSVQGKKDGWEGIMFFEHPLSKYPSDEPLPAPTALQRKRDLIEEVIANMGDISRLILDSLSKSLSSLHLGSGANFLQHHQREKPSASSLQILKYLPYTPACDKVGHAPHKDMGSLSMVFSEVGGLQVYDPRKKAWVFIEPKPGHAVCNIGDSLEFLSGSILRSSLHRVVPYPSKEEKARVSVLYFLRPDNDAEFTDRSGRRWKTLEWHDMKAKIFANGLEEQAPRLVITGREGYQEFWDEPRVDELSKHYA